MCMAAFVGALLLKRQGIIRETPMRKRENILLQRTTPTAGLRRIRIVIFANRTPYRWNEVICCCLAVSYETCARFADTYAWTTEILT